MADIEASSTERAEKIDQHHKELKQVWTKCVQKEMKSQNITETTATGSTDVSPTDEQLDEKPKQVSEVKEDPNAVHNGLKRLEEAREIFQQIGDTAKEGQACRSLSVTLHSLRYFKEAVQNDKVCLELAKKERNKLAEGCAHSFIGMAYHQLFEFQAAIGHHKQHLRIAKELGDRDGEGIACHNLGTAYNEISEFSYAIDCFKSYLEISKELGNKHEEGLACGNLGNAYRRTGNLSLALRYFNMHLSIAKAVGNRSEEGATYGSLGDTHFNLGDFKKAQEYYTLYLEVVKELADSVMEGGAYTKLGVLFCTVGNLEKARDYLQKGLAISQECGNKVGVEAAYNGLGICYESLGEFRKATEYHTMHLRIAKEVGNREGEVCAHGNLGNLFFRLGNVQQAIQYQTLSLEVAKEIGSKYGEGQAYGNLGKAHHLLGLSKKAIQYHQAHLAIAKKMKDRDGEGSAYTALGIAYSRLCDFKRAIECQEEALRIAVEIRSFSRQSTAYSNLGICYLELGDFKKAIKYLNLYKNRAAKVGDKDGEGNAYCSLGYAHQSDGDLRSADRYLDKGLEIAVKIGDKALEERVYANLGNSSMILGDFQRAIEHHERSLSIAKDLGDRDGEARASGNLGVIYRSLEDYKKALAFFEEDLKIAQEIGNIAGAAKSYYNQGANYQAMGLTNDALHCYEASVTGYNKVRSQLQDKDEWKISIQNKHQKATKAWWTLLKGQGKTNEALNVLERGRAQALEDLMNSKYRLGESPSKQQMIDKTDIIHVSSNVYYAAVDGNEINTWYIQEGRTVLFTMKELDNTTLQQAATVNLESYVNLMLEIICPIKDRRCQDRSLDGLRDLTPSAKFEDKVASLPKTYSSDDGARSETPHEHFLKTLYNITVGSVADMNCGNELIIVPDGPLFKVPFAALIDSNSRYLCESSRIRLLPSLTTLKLILDAPDDYHLRKGALIVGDPCLEEIVVKRGRTTVRALDQLPSAKEEAEMVGRILNTTPLIGQEATKIEVLKRLGNVALVHIAAHGRSETGEIALTPNPSRASEIPDERDFLLTMKEVLDVGLRAQLVVLSCCYSGRGEINTEGVVGIARAFLGAGARSVLVSLWAIDDQATKEFMAYFYQKLMNGKSASEALNQAMNDMRESPKFAAAKYWAPFVLIGDDVRLEFEKDRKNS